VIEDTGSISRPVLPVGTVTFLRTDVEGSMGLALLHGSAWDGINAAHLDLLRSAVAANGGVSVRTEGDALFAAFPEAGAAIRSAVDGQRAIAGRSWPGDRPIAVRMGLHTGEAHLAGDDYGGFDVNRVARIAAVAHGGQIVVSGTTQALVEGSLPQGVRIRDLGRHSLKDVPAPEHIFQLEAEGLRTEFPPLRVEASTSGNLPDRLTSFVGRDRELGELDRLLDEARLVTLTGPSGIGKTSLAVEVARRHVQRAADGAWLIALDTITDPALVPAVIARTLGLFDGAEHPAVDALPGFLARRSTILVLDNFEHLLGAAGDVSALVRASPASRVIVTSRAPLRVQGEHDFPVAPLIGEGAENAAADLFVDRVRAVRPGWEPGPDAPVVREICELLDGLPLGIELAAARMAVLPAAAIRDRLAAHLPLPGAGPRDAPARQRTLEGAIGWSHDLLDPAAQAAFHQLGVFQGGFDASQAEAVVRSTDGTPRADLLDVLVGLAEQSLIGRQAIDAGIAEYPVGSGIRFAMLRTVQDFAARRLAEDGDEAAVRRRHALAYLDLAETAAAHLPSSTQPPWLDRVGLDIANLRAAMRWAVDAGETDLALRFVAAMWRYWQIDGHLTEGRAYADDAFAMPGAEAHTPTRLAAVTAAGGLAYWAGDRIGSNARYQEQLALAQELADKPATADAWLNLAATNFIRGDPAESIRCGTEAMRLFVELGDERGMNRMAWGYANMALDTEGFEASISNLLAVRARAVELDDAVYAAIAGGSLSWVSFMAGDTIAASRWSLQTILELYRLRDLAGATISLPAAAVTALELGRPEVAAVLMGAFESLCERYGVRPPLGLAEMIGRKEPTAQLVEQLEPEELAAATARGARMSLDDAIELVVDLLDSLPGTGPTT
jgi:predicted ATPase/class 3 adenylate cyclase